MKENKISDLTPLQSLPRLTELYLGCNPLAQQQIDELQRALPQCDIYF
jgi:Leucine-rich repeat (LRR) protein